MRTQIHVTNGTSVQTLAARLTPEGVTLFSTLLGEETELHIPASARAWLIKVLAGEAANDDGTRRESA